jgi:hypothetical protein
MLPQRLQAKLPCDAPAPSSLLDEELELQALSPESDSSATPEQNLRMKFA